MRVVCIMVLFAFALQGCGHKGVLLLPPVQPLPAQQTPASQPPADAHPAQEQKP